MIPMRNEKSPGGAKECSPGREPRETGTGKTDSPVGATEIFIERFCRPDGAACTANGLKPGVYTPGYILPPLCG